MAHGLQIGFVAARKRDFRMISQLILPIDDDASRPRLTDPENPQQGVTATVAQQHPGLNPFQLDHR
ncbi:hypothetical protein [Azotobacter beijerinckii]|uniref:hypothetical protein n=1 Tax=Azotobacter beijerinckii TaxID=170623 RepID=UPI00295435D8|nr:hypothetical protein [Azotobacter beijerinckii]